MPLVEQAGLEIMSAGLFGLFALTVSVIVTMAQLLRGDRTAHHQLIGLMIAFVMGTERSQAKVVKIHAILLNHFMHNESYTELTTAVASFVPGGTAPFQDEARLADAFRVFLRSRKIYVPDAPQDCREVWPPPPNVANNYHPEIDH